MAPIFDKPFKGKAAAAPVPNVLKDLGQIDAAIAGHKQAIERNRDVAHAYCDLHREFQTV
jgi:hypothetical protein